VVPAPDTESRAGSNLPGMDLEYFWAAVCWAVVIGLGALMTWIFLILPFQPHDH